MGIGTRLQQLLEKRGMRPGTLAREAGVSKNTVYSMLKRNNAKADGDILARLARVLDVPVSALVADDVPEREMPAVIILRRSGL